MTKKKLLKLITDEEREILKNYMLRDNLYKQKIYYNKYIKELKNKYTNPTRKYLYLVIIFFILTSVTFAFKSYSKTNTHTLTKNENNLMHYEKTADKVKTLNQIKKKTNKVNKIPKIYTSKITFNYGYCTKNECIINVLNHKKQINEYITLSINNKKMVLNLKKGMTVTLD